MGKCYTKPIRTSSIRARNRSLRFAVAAAAMPKRALSPVNENFAVANELRIASEAIAQAAVARDYQRRPALLAKYGERGRAMYLQDTRFHLSYLADAISFGLLVVILIARPTGLRSSRGCSVGQCWGNSRTWSRSRRTTTPSRCCRSSIHSSGEACTANVLPSPTNE